MRVWFRGPLLYIRLGAHGYRRALVPFLADLLYSQNFFPMNARSHCRRLLIAVAVLCLAPFLRAQDGLKGALSQTTFGVPSGHTLAPADLDGDNQADGAILLNSTWTGTHNNVKIQLHFTARPNTEISFESTVQALTIRAWDIDHDGDNDLVVEEALTHKPVRVWINEGNGDFHEGRIEDYPSLAQGTAEQVQLPSNDPFSLALWVPQQRGFEISILSAHLYGRPPSSNSFLSMPATPPSTLSARGVLSSRAPPLFS